MKKNVFFCYLFAFLLILPGLLMLCLPVRTFSESENRMLASWPEIDVDALVDGSYFKNLGKYYADHFPFRTELIKCKSTAELAMGKKQNGNVFFGKDLYQIKRLEQCDKEMLATNKKAADAIAAHVSKNQKPCAVLYAPRAIDVLTCKLPAGYPALAAAAPWEILPRSPLIDHLAAKAERGENIWYRTDHHWTTLGAYYAYEYLGESLGYTPLPLHTFSKEKIKNDFIGTSASASLFPFKKADSIYRYRYEGDEDFIIKDLSTGQTHQGLYYDEKLNTADAYASFLGGNFAHLKIQKNQEDNRPLLLIIKDSYANCLAPFLAYHFDLELIDTRYLRSASFEMLDSVTQNPNYAGALLIWNAETLCSDAGLLPFLKK